MKIVPVINSGDLQRPLHFYTQVLDFDRKWPGHKDREMVNGVIDLVQDGWNYSFPVVQEMVFSARSTACLWTMLTSATGLSAPGSEHNTAA